MNILDKQTIKHGYDKILCLVVGRVYTNCYVYISNNEAIVVDPGASGLEIASLLDGVDVKYIVATHGHGDHVGGVKALRDKTGATYCINQKDEAEAMTAGEDGPFGFAYDDNAPKADMYLHEHDTISVGDATFEVVETPGHTPGGICLVGRGSAEGILFVGDSLFAGGIGRCDLSGGNYPLLIKSLKHLIEVVPKSYKVLSGHGDRTTLEKEIYTNPYLL